MREYRGKRIDNGVMIYGWYAELEGNPVIYPFESPAFNHEVIPKTVGQYIGLKDNDIKVYEGDVFGTNQNKGVVELNTTVGAYRIWSLDTKTCLWSFPLSNYTPRPKLIGNIHEGLEKK